MKDQIHTFQEHAYSVNNILKEIGLLDFLLLRGLIKSH